MVKTRYYSFHKNVRIFSDFYTVRNNIKFYTEVRKPKPKGENFTLPMES